MTMEYLECRVRELLIAWHHTTKLCRHSDTRTVLVKQLFVLYENEFKYDYITRRRHFSEGIPVLYEYDCRTRLVRSVRRVSYE